MQLTKQSLHDMKEKAFREHLIELYEKMGYRDVDHYHGARELGKDILMWSDFTGQRVNIAVVKAGDITGSAAVKKGSAGEVFAQVAQAFGSEALDIHLQKFKADKVFVVCNGNIAPSARESLRAMFQGSPRSDSIEFFGLEMIWQMTSDHFGSKMLWGQLLADHATAWLVAQKVLLPGASLLERVVARVRSRANNRLWRLLAAGITAEQKQRLEGLLLVPEGGRQSPLDRLRSGPTLQSTAEIVRAIRRLDEIRELTAQLPSTEHLPKTRLLSLALAWRASSGRAGASNVLPNHFSQSLRSTVGGSLLIVSISRPHAKVSATRSLWKSPVRLFERIV